MLPCCCPLHLFHQAPLTPREDKPWSSPTPLPPSSPAPSGLSCKAPQECELIRFAVQGDVGTDGRGGNCEGDLQGTMCNTSDGACGCSVRQTEMGEEEEGGGDHWSLNYMHAFLMPMATSSALHFVSVSSALQHMYYLYAAYVSLITHECIFANGAFGDLLQLTG